MRELPGGSSAGRLTAPTHSQLLAVIAYYGQKVAEVGLCGAPGGGGSPADSLLWPAGNPASVAWDL